MYPCNDHQDFPKKRVDLFSYITDVIERLKKDSKRRTELMGILAGESSYNNILAFVWLKVKTHRESAQQRAIF